MKREALRYLYASGKTNSAIARELYLSTNTLPMLVGVLDIATAQQVAEVIAEVMQRTCFATHRQRAVTVQGLDVYLERTQYAHPDHLLMVVNRKTDAAELARNLADYEPFPVKENTP